MTRSSEQDVTIPVNTKATVYVPRSDVQGITERDTPASKVERIKFHRHEAGSAVFEVPSGNYRFEAPM
jgi:alpha-L-rhamnosidase